MTHPQVFGQKFTPIRRFLAWKTHPFWPHIPNMTQYGSAPRGKNSEFDQNALRLVYIAQNDFDQSIILFRERSSYTI